ncbi:uncharacterized protein LOC105278440 [Ooceraea biroi]|uniref:uncharacterized protein LOC105278440 n=1 Tax=Ooceraea biroi TaxID=2015173 RepID=UPI000F079811|nr:uncharacterized protein LOC105278440 [Ooceraea biroi]
MTTSINNNNMEIDMNISDILREVITFLECLCDVKLPLKLERLRQELLAHAKETLSVTRASSPDRPYLDMNSGPKSLLLIKNKTETDSEEYVGMEGSQKQPHQDYYETCENQGKTPPPSAMLPKSMERYPDHDLRLEEAQKLLRIYKNLPAAQSRSKCHKCGPIYKKEGKKLFLPESRACWIALVGSHLLVYRNERQPRPYVIYAIRGYMARAAPHVIPNDRQKKDSAFEIYKPGNETLQFIARTPKDMDQWIAKVHEVGCGGKENVNSDVEIREKQRATNELSPCLNRREKNKEMRHQDAAGNPMTTNKSVESLADQQRDEKKKRGKETVENPPPLPSRIPRRLPSLPPDSAIPSYRVAVEDDDDDDEIYHKIEDLINGTCYQNLALRRRRAIEEQQDVISYDDIHGTKEKEEEQMQGKADSTMSQEETYDDIVPSRTNASAAKTEHQDNQSGSGPAAEKEKEFYDDVENLISNGKIAKDRAKDQTDTSSKSPQKKSFLGRVLSRKEFYSKSPEKKYKGKNASSNPPPSSVAAEEMPTYDDVSDLTANQESLVNDEELSEYNCPPPPRPVYTTKSPIVNNLDDQVEEIYDDVNTCREQYNKSHQQSTQESRSREAKSDAAVCNADQGMNDGDNLPQEEEIEHYQSPRSDLRICEVQQTTEIQQTEEDLYDDVALLIDFKSRPRNLAEQKDNEDSRSTGSPDKKSWNRFGVNRRSRTSDGGSTCAEQTNGRSSNDCEEAEDALDKKNTFKKLISKMENSLARVSTRNSTSPLTAKSSTANNNF